ncbi:MAG: sialidase family protein [Thermoleophilaceae bacterium]
MKEGTTMKNRSMYRILTALLALAGLATAVSSAAASVNGPVRITAAGFACPPGTVTPDPNNGANYPSAEVEPYVALNPRNPRNAVAIWQQDRWSNGGANGLGGGYTTDGGTTWSQTAAPFSHCTGGNAANNGNYDRATDPWATFAPDGTAYFISLSLAVPDFNPHEVAVARSTNGGATWSSPVTLLKDTSGNFSNDKESISADPGNANYVYAVWDRLVIPNEQSQGDAPGRAFASYGPTWFARTTNGGGSWQAARKIYDPALDGPGQGRNDQTIGNQIVVLPNGTLVDGFALAHNDNAHHRKGIKVALIRSTDKGATWEQHATVAARELTVGVSDPTTGAPLRTSDELPEIAVDRSSNGRTRGNLYAVWQDARFNNGDHDEIAFARSTDGGNTWSDPKRISTPTGKAAFTAAIAVAGDGTVGVVYYDLRHDDSGAPLATDVWMTISSDGGATWSEQHLSGPFDMTKAPEAGGYFVGDYIGLTVGGNTFHPVWVEATGTQNVTDVYTASVTR